MSFIALPSLFALPPVNLAILKLPPIKSSTQVLYKCTLCPKEFNYKSSLSRHFLIHTGEKRFSCNVCEKSFNRKDTLNQHRKARKCIFMSQRYRIMGIHDNHIRDTKFAKSISSQVISSSTIDERMSISWLSTNSPEPTTGLSNIDDYQTSSFPFYYIKFSNSIESANKIHET